MTNSCRKTLKLIFLLLTCVILILSLAELSFAAPEKSVTIYTTRLATGETSYDFCTAFGTDTLVTPASATGFEITWTSSDPDVAEVDEHGRVLAKLTGPYESEASSSCTITATCSWQGMTKSDSIKVTAKRGVDITGCFFFNSSDIASPKMNSLDDFDEEPQTPETIEESLQHDHVEGQMLVVFDDDMRESRIKRILQDNAASLEQISPLGDDQKAVVASAESEEALQEVMSSLNEEDTVAYVQPNYTYELNDGEDILDDGSTPEDGGTSEDGNTPENTYQEDPYYGQQYFHKMMNIEAAWELLKEKSVSQPAIVGVLDSGIDADHADLAGNLILNEGTYRKYTSSGESDATEDPTGHGTHVSGIICSIYGNGIGGAGVASGTDNSFCKVLPVGIVNNDSIITTGAVIKGINYAVNSGARIINMSFSGSVKDRAIGKAISDNYYNNGIVFVSSAGNKDNYKENYADNINGTCRLECLSFPSDMNEVISVCNVQSDGKKNRFTYSGLSKDISAPGTSIYSAKPYDQSNPNATIYKSLTGTSMSTPMVSAVAALILDANPDLTPQEVRNIICATAYDTKNDYYKSNEVGYGLIDAKACVEAAYKARESAAPADFSFSIKGYYNGEPEPYALSKTILSNKVTRTISMVSSYKAKGGRKKVLLSFRKTPLVTDTKTEAENKYITGETGITTSTTKKSSTSGVRYQIRVKYGGKTRYYRIKPSKKKSAKITIHPVGKATIHVSVKQFKGKRFKPNRKCYVAVRAYKEIDGKIKYGKWSKTITVRTK